MSNFIHYNNIGANLSELASDLDRTGDWQDVQCIGAALMNALTQVDRLQQRVRQLEKQIDQVSKAAGAPPIRMATF